MKRERVTQRRIHYGKSWAMQKSLHVDPMDAPDELQAGLVQDGARFNIGAFDRRGFSS